MHLVSLSMTPNNPTPGLRGNVDGHTRDQARAHTHS